MKTLAAIFMATWSSLALATPGDIGCHAQLNGKSIELLIGFDHFGISAPALLQISENGKIVFASPDIDEGMVNVGTPQSPVLNKIWTASDEESTATVRVPEQSREELTNVVVTVVTDSGLFKVNELEMTCER